MTEPTVLSDDDAKKVAQEVATLLVKPADEPTQDITSNTPALEYSDPIVKLCEEEMAKCIEALPKGTIILKGKNSTQRINQSAESMEVISNYLSNRRNWRTRENIR
mgnify:CR=1 FL=1